MKLHESPVFKELKKAGNTSKSPILESFGSCSNIRTLLIVIFGVVAGQASIGYTSHLYAMFFMTQKLKVLQKNGAGIAKKWGQSRFRDRI